MTRQELHTFLTTHFDLVFDPVERGCARTYFLGKVAWHPSTTTRILHVQCDAVGVVSQIKRCVSSDNNNSVFVRLPMDWPALLQIVTDEIALHLKPLHR
ncbi:hypothetical protein PI87_18650 [Ralstonia sp. A12]|uniref:hypothetical protein n=1 Tax=Ralstonia sp. A12 TaxID=1217052 RepID=UPI0005752EB2|nr:hypothetical protein [Ralstonia sp. A12]KHK52823.1 hypothetical protein PI87_18650 [Ralstonia sp. A12]